MSRVCAGRLGFPYPLCAKAYALAGDGSLRLTYACLQASRPRPPPPSVGISRVKSELSPSNYPSTVPKGGMPDGYCVTASSLDPERLLIANWTGLAWLCLCFTDYCNGFSCGPVIGLSI